jgi:hypothetical protein
MATLSASILSQQPPTILAARAPVDRRARRGGIGDWEGASGVSLGWRARATLVAAAVGAGHGGGRPWVEAGSAGRAGQPWFEAGEAGRGARRTTSIVGSASSGAPWVPGGGGRPASPEALPSDLPVTVALGGVGVRVGDLEHLQQWR